MDAFKSFIGKIKEMNLREEERDCVWKNLAAFVKVRPVKTSANLSEDHTREWGTLSQWFTAFLHSITLRLSIAHVIIVVFFITSTGLTAFAAELSEPGDFLHSFKVDVVEEVIGVVLSGSPEVAAGWEVERIERRLEEVGALALSNALGQEEALWVVGRIGDRTNEILTLALELESGEEEDDAEDVVSGLESSLHAGDRVFTYLSTNGITQRTRRNLSLISTELRRAEVEAENKVADLEEGLIADLREEPEILTDEVREAEQSIEAAVRAIAHGAEDSQLLSEAESKIESARLFLSTARRGIGADKENKQAFLQASEAGRIAEEAEEMLALQAEVLEEL